jgi:hypothetical protein
MNDLSLQIKQYNITCKIKDLEKDFEWLIKRYFTNW